MGLLSWSTSPECSQAIDLSVFFLSFYQIDLSVQLLTDTETLDKTMDSEVSFVVFLMLARSMMMNPMQTFLQM